MLVHDPLLRRGRPSIDDLAMHMLLLYLLPFTVHVDHRARRAEREREASRQRAAVLLNRIPTQRRSPEPARQPVPRGTGRWHG